MRPEGAMGMGDWGNQQGAAAAAAAMSMGFPSMAARMQMAAAGLPAPHVNPAFLAGQMGMAGNMPSQPDFGGNVGDLGGSSSSLNGLGLGADDFEATVVQMKQVASNAISRAAAECKTGLSASFRLDKSMQPLET